MVDACILSMCFVFFQVVLFLYILSAVPQFCCHAPCHTWYLSIFQSYLLVDLQYNFYCGFNLHFDEWVLGPSFMCLFATHISLWWSDYPNVHIVFIGIIFFILSLRECKQKSEYLAAWFSYNENEAFVKTLIHMHGLFWFRDKSS